MVLVYNFSNSNVEYSLQWMSEHIELMGQLSSMTVKVPRVSRDRGHTCLPPPPATSLLSSTADSETPSRPVPTVQHPSPSGLYSPDDSGPPSLAGGVGLKGGTSPEYTSRDPHPGQPAPEGPWTRTRQRDCSRQCKVWGAEGNWTVAQTHHGQRCLGPVVKKAMLQEGSGRGLPPLLYRRY